MQLHTQQIGPMTTGFMTMEGAGSGATVAWVADPPVGGFPTANCEYWFMPLGFPSALFSAVQGSGQGPSYSSHQGSWRCAENKPFGPPASSFSVSIAATDHIYDVTCFLNGNPVGGASFQMWVRQAASGPQMGWVANNLPAGQIWLFPEGTTGTMALRFDPKPPATYTFPNGVRVAVGPMTTV